jgi:hypothetical protein
MPSCGYVSSGYLKAAPNHNQASPQQMDFKGGGPIAQTDSLRSYYDRVLLARKWPQGQFGRALYSYPSSPHTQMALGTTHSTW